MNMIQIVMVAFLVTGSLLTLKDFYHDVKENGRLTYIYPITFAMHTLLGLPLLVILFTSSAVKQVIENNKEV